jgi:hypothetical protein
MVDNWIDCPHCGRNVASFPDECRSCGKDLRFLPDGSPNPAQENKFLKAMQAGSFVDKAVFAVILLMFAGLVLRFLF